MAYKDLDTFFDPDLHLPIKGNWYTVPAPGAEDCLAPRTAWRCETASY